MYVTSFLIYKQTNGHGLLLDSLNCCDPATYFSVNMRSCRSLPLPLSSSPITGYFFEAILWFPLVVILHSCILFTFCSILLPLVLQYTCIFLLWYFVTTFFFVFKVIYKLHSSLFFCLSCTMFSFTYTTLAKNPYTNIYVIKLTYINSSFT